MFSLHFLGNDRFAKNNKVAGYQLLPPLPLLSLLFLSSLSSIKRFCNVYSQAAISGAVLVEVRSMTYGDLGAKALLSVLVVVSH